MKSNQGPLEWLKSKLAATNKSSPPGKNSSKPTYLLILLLLGAVFMILGSIWNSGPGSKPVAGFYEEGDQSDSSATFGQKKVDQDNEMKLIEEQYENQLREVLEQIVGVHSVTVMVTVESTEQKIFEKNSILKSQTTHEEDEKGGTRKIEDQSKEDQLVTVRDGEKEAPLISATTKPEFKGVLIVAGGCRKHASEKMDYRGSNTSLGYSKP